MKFEFMDEIWGIDDRCIGKQGSFNPNIEDGLKLDDSETTGYIKELTKEFRKDDVFLDIGANFGTMSLASQCKTYCFEPCKSTFTLLKSNIKLNPQKDITPICEAVAEKEKDYHVVEHAGGYTGMNRIEEGGDRTTITIDNWANQNNIKNIKLIKIDTEGHDNLIIQGAREIIERDKPIIIVEAFDEETTKSINYKETFRIGEKGVMINHILVHEKD